MLSRYAIRFCVTAAAALLLAPFQAHAWPLDLPVLWHTDLATLLESTPVAADINGDGLDEIIAAGREEMFALDGTGRILWHWRTKGRFMTDPAVFHAPDGKALIYAADNQGQFTCLDGAGHVVWQAQLKGPSVWSGTVIDILAPNGPPVVIQTDGTGVVWAFEYATGHPLWQAQVEGAPVTPAVGDIDGDGKKEIVVATEKGGLFAIRSDGTPLWNKQTCGPTPLWAASSPVIFKTATGAARIVAAANEEKISCLDGQGNVLWTRPARGGVDSSISVCDFDDNGVCDVFFATQLGVIYRYTENGDLLWEIDMQGRSLAPGAILDINNDGRLEYVLCTQNGRLMVIDQAGQFLFETQFPHRTIGVTPAFGHFLKGSKTLQAAITGGESGILLCLDTPALLRTKSEWISYRRDTRNTGFWSSGPVSPKPGPNKPQAAAGTASPVLEKPGYSMFAKDFAADKLISGDDVEFLIHLEQAPVEPLRAEAAYVTPNGSRHSSISRVIGKRGVLRLPLDLSLAGKYEFAWTLANADGTHVCAGSKEIPVEPCKNEKKLADAASAALENAKKAVEKNLPHTAAALSAQLESLSKLKVVGAGEFSELLRQAHRAIPIAALFQDASKLAVGTALLAFQGTTWDSRAVPSQIPSKAQCDLTMQRRLVPGEHDAVSVLLFNTTDKDLNVRIKPEEKPDEALRVELLHSVPVPTSLGETSWDPLPPLRDQPLAIKSMQCGELWLDVDATHAQPGHHAVSFTAQVVSGLGDPNAQPSETKIAVEYNVLPFDMAPPGAFRLCAWANAKNGDWQDLLDHGNNVFIAPLPPLPDCSKLDEVLAKLAGHDVMMLLTGAPALKGEVGSEEYIGQLKTYLEDLTKHMAGKGIDTAHFALYPFDEPGGNGWNAVKGYVAFGKAVRAANPSILIYVDGGCELPMAELMKPVTDIWTPSIYELPDKADPLMKVIRDSGKTCWSYNCGYGFARPVGANLKNINIPGEYRTAALFALNYGATGIGFWSYNIGDDLWNRTEMEYPLVYKGEGKPVASRRWKAVRESIEDARIFMALKERAEKSDNKALREKVNKLATETLPTLFNPSEEEMRLCLARYVLDATNNDAMVNTLRKTLMDCAELSAAK